MSEWWDKQIQRADQLAPKATDRRNCSLSMPSCFAAQKDIYDYLRSRKDWLPSGDLESDWPVA